MSTFDTLPVILVSAANQDSATALISELIDDDVTDDYHKDTQSPDRVWRLVNKYYTANVRVHPLKDDGRLDVDPDTVEAHIIYITEDELKDGRGGSGVAAAEARAAVGAPLWRRCGVRLLLVAGAREPAALCAWAAAARAELVALREPGGGGRQSADAERQPADAEREAVGVGREPADEGREAAGVGRARAALHAHAWRGLVRTDRAARPPPPPPGEAGSGSSSGGSDAEDVEEGRAVEHAEAFAAALGALGPALAARERGAPPDARHERAEALVAAFCRALGYDLDAC